LESIWQADGGVKEEDVCIAEDTEETNRFYLAVWLYNISPTNVAVTMLPAYSSEGREHYNVNVNPDVAGGFCMERIRGGGTGPS
jgi:autonomous glycyl radical cofactor GrcA